ncbi:hypothetical protein CRUP_019467 [Coryphaenoides rupestris]|nr:hypothetical protein CRUP_019467 [Coryphaenoides rupestris]
MRKSPSPEINSSRRSWRWRTSQEQHLEQHYNEVLQTLSHRYDDRAAGLAEQKKSKLEALYGQLLGCGRTMDASKELIEAAQGVYRSQDPRLFLKAVMPTIRRIKEFAKEELDLSLCTSLEFTMPEDDLSDVKTMMDSINVVPAPSAPVINPQMANSATQTSLRVRWNLFSDDTVEFYELYYRPVLEDTPVDNTHETHCTVTDLLPNAQYELWVTATNTTGISPASEKALYMTAAVGEALPGHRQSREHRRPQRDELSSGCLHHRCVAALGDLLPVRGRHYWEVEVDDDTEFRIGVAYEDTNRNAYLGATSTSWCMRHILTPTRHKYEFLHDGWSPDLRITVNPGYVQPCFALDQPGALTVHNGMETPGYTLI